MVRELIVLHERAVDDWHAEVDVEQDRHRLQLTNDDVAEDANERKDSFRVRDPAGQLTARTFPLLEQPFERSLQEHARHADRVQQHEQRHAGSAQPAVHRHFLTCGDGKRDSLRVAVQQIYVARSSGERARHVDSIADVLHAVRRVAGDDAPRGLVVETERRNTVVLSMKHSRLAIRCRRGQSAEPASERKSFAQQPGDRRTEAELQCAPQIGVRQRVDLQHD